VFVESAIHVIGYPGIVCAIDAMEYITVNHSSKIIKIRVQERRSGSMIRVQERRSGSTIRVQDRWFKKEIHEGKNGR
jgi:mevalonate kinase